MTAEPAAPADPPGRVFRTGTVLTLAAGHFVHDLYTAFLSPVLPLLIRGLSLSLAQAGTLHVFLQLPTLLNPFLGSWVDRHGYIRPLVVAAPTATAVALCLIGVAPSYGALALLLLVAGISVAAVHVAAPVAMADAAAGRLGLGMSCHMLGGELARTVGPLLVVQAVLWWGLPGIWRLIPLGVIASLLLWWRLDAVTPSAAREAPTGLLMVCRRMWRVLVAVFGIMTARAFLAAALTTFLPTFLVTVEAASLWSANVALAVFEGAGAAGVLTAGTLSDRLGRRRVLLAAVLLAPPLMWLFLQTGGGLRLGVLAALGFVTLSTTPVLMALTIEHAGADRAAANGTFIMISFAARSFVVPAVGAFGDALGLEQAFLICGGLAVLGVPFVALLPRSPGQHEGATDA